MSGKLDKALYGLKQVSKACNEPNYSVSFIIQSKSALGNDASTASIAKINPGNSAPSDFVPQQYGTILAARQIKEETSSIIKLEDLSKLVSHVQPSIKDQDSPEDDPVIVVHDSDEDKDDKVHTTENIETEDTLVPKSLSPSSLPTNLRDIPSKLNELAREVKGLIKQVHELEIELPGDLKEIPTKLDDFIKNVASVQAKLKTLDALPSLLLYVIQDLNKFAEVLNFASSKAVDQSVSSAGQADTMPTEEEKNTNQATISQPFQIRAEKNTEKENLNNQQPKPAPPHAITIIPPVMPSKDVEEVSTESESDDETTHVPASMVKSYKKKELKKFDFVTESGEHVHLTKEQIGIQKKIEEEAKAEAARREGEIRKEELIDLLGPEVVNKYYNDKLQYDRYYDDMLNRRQKSRITNCGILTRKGLITLKVYKEDNTSEIILEFKASDLHLAFACDLSLLWCQLIEIMPPRMRTRCAGRRVAKSREGGTGEGVGKGGKGRGPRRGNDERVDELNSKGNDQGKIKRYVYGLAPQIHRMVAVTEPKTMHKAVQISYTLIDEAVRNGSIKKVEKRGNVGERSKDKNGRNDNKRTRNGNAFAIAANLTYTPRITKRGRDTEIPQSSGPTKKVGDEAVYTKEDDIVVRVPTTAASLEAEPKSEVHIFRSGEDSMEHQDDLIDFIPPRPHDSPLSGGHTPGSDEGRTKIYELMNILYLIVKQGSCLETFQGCSRLGDQKDVNAVEPVSTAGDAVNTASVIPDVSAASPSTSCLKKKPQFKREQRITRGKAAEQEAKDAALIEQIEDVQARIDADVLLAEKLQQEEREQFTINEQARMLVDLIAERNSEQQAKSSKKRSRADHVKESVKKQKLEKNDAEIRNLELVWIKFQ
uniref:Uncharacterized protein n=1 Tax=Tanacetum cinerariifolium TaxID=118510 RepID=A0A6L2MWT1_TANCI|nr:hypothetical protein [Tanacetum cinerariifolium]